MIPQYQLKTAFFNTSIVKINDDRYLCAVRYFSAKKDDMVPGNDKNCPLSSEADQGVNFIWNHWRGYYEHGQMLSGTDFFIWDYKMKTLSKPELKGYVYRKYEFRVEKDDISGNNFQDVRITRIRDKIYMYTTDMDTIYQLVYVEETNTLKFFPIMFDFFTKRVYSGRNLNIIDIDYKKVASGIDIQLYITDWFYDNNDVKGVKFQKPSLSNYNPLNDYTKGFEYKPHDVVIKFGESHIDGNGSYITDKMDDILKFKSNYGITPAFSFSTPHIDVIYDGKQSKLGVGHIKIHNDQEKYRYVENSHIDKFRKNIHNDLRQRYGDRYKIHFGSGYPQTCYGFIYTMYFYILTDKDENGDYQNMYISDSYLPISLDDRGLNDDYKFSIVFPMGIEMLGDDKIIVTCGYGDFYSIALEFDTTILIPAFFRHNVKQLDMRHFNYWIIASKDNKTYLSRSFKRIDDVIAH